MARRNWSIRVEWKPQDCWIGVFWKRSAFHGDDGTRVDLLDVWVCILPMLPLHVRRADA